MITHDISGLKIPDSKLARDVTEFIRDTESDLLFHHSGAGLFLGSHDRKSDGADFRPGTATHGFDVPRRRPHGTVSRASFASKWTARMQRGISCAAMPVSPRATSRRCGTR